MAVCPKCGAYNPDSYEFCSRCGEMLQTVKTGAPSKSTYGMDRKGLRYLLIVMQIVPCVLGLYLLFGYSMEVDYLFFDGGMTAMDVVDQGWYSTNLSTSGMSIVLWISAILFILGLVMPVFHIFGGIMTVALGYGMSGMFDFTSAGAIPVDIAVGGLEALGAVALVLGVVGLALWFAVVVRGPCSTMSLKLKLAYVWTGRIGERGQRSPREPVHDTDPVDVHAAVPEDRVHDAGAVHHVAGVVCPLHDADAAVLHR